MKNNPFSYDLPQDIVVFTDTLKEGAPYISEVPRNHESLFFVTKGSLLYEKESKKEIVAEGQVGYIAKGSKDISSPYLCDEVSYISIIFNFDTKNPISQSTLPFTTVCSQSTLYQYEALFKDALDSFLFKTPGYKIICGGILLQIIGYLYNETRLTDNNYQKIVKIEKAIEFLINNYDNPNFKINNLADICHMSEKNFRRIFFSVYNKTPYAFLQDFRIKKSKILLLNTEKSVSEIASQCGFSDVYGFSHSFKKHVGISPNKYRQKQFTALPKP